MHSTLPFRLSPHNATVIHDAHGNMVGCTSGHNAQAKADAQLFVDGANLLKGSPVDAIHKLLPTLDVAETRRLRNHLNAVLGDNGPFGTREIASILHGLRIIQELRAGNRSGCANAESYGLAEAECDHFTHRRGPKPLTSEEIDALCEDLNVSFTLEERIAADQPSPEDQAEHIAANPVATEEEIAESRTTMTEDEAADLLTKLYPYLGCGRRESIATGTLAIFTADGRNYAHTWKGALERATKEERAFSVKYITMLSDKSLTTTLHVRADSPLATAYAIWQQTPIRSTVEADKWEQVLRLAAEAIAEANVTEVADDIDVTGVDLVGGQ